MNSPGQKWDVYGYRNFASFVPALGEPLLNLLKAKPGEHILDVGCGEGSLTRKIMESGAKVTGIDADADMVAAARKSGIEAFVISGTNLAFERRFDAVFSNAALHWMKPPEDVLKGVHKALKDEGRFVVEMGGSGNTNASRTALHTQLRARGINPEPYDPWFFPSAEEYTGLLEKNGFHVLQLTHFARPTALTGDVLHWLKIFGQSFLKALPPEAHDAYLTDTAAQLRQSLPKDDAGNYLLDYVRLQFKAV